MILANKWPENLDYVACDSYTGSNAPKRSIDLKTFFVNVTEPATYGTFTFNNDVEFNGNSMLKFDMDILGVTVRSGNECNEKNLGNWTAAFSAPFHMDSMKEVGELNVTRVYRVSTVVVKLNNEAIRIQTLSNEFFSLEIFNPTFRNHHSYFVIAMRPKDIVA